MTIEEIIQQEITPRVTRFWGHDYEDFHPALLTKIFGDGQRLMFFNSIDTRPYYYLARIDSQYPNLSDEDGVIDFVEQALIDALEDEFGRGYDEDEDGETVDKDKGDWPALILETGFSWGFYDENGNIL